MDNEQVIIRVLSSLPVDRAFQYRAVNRKWKELIEQAYWFTIVAKIEEFQREWESALDDAEKDIDSLIKLMEEHIAKDPNKDIEKIIGYLKESPPTKTLRKLYDNFIKDNSFSWRQKMASLVRYRNAVNKTLHHLEENEEFNLCCFNPFQIGDKKPKHLLKLPQYLQKVNKFFDQGKSMYEFPSEDDNNNNNNNA